MTPGTDASNGVDPAFIFDDIQRVDMAGPFAVGVGIVDIVGAVLVIAGGLVCWRAGRRYVAVRRAVRRAESTSGTITRVAVQAVHGGGGRSYVPVVEYTYRTPTARREGETLYPGGDRFVKRFGTESAAERAVAPYTPSSSTTVYYDPRAPEHAFLEAEPQTAGTLGRAALGIGLFALGVAVVIAI